MCPSSDRDNSSRSLRTRWSLDKCKCEDKLCAACDTESLLVLCGDLFCVSSLQEAVSCKPQLGGTQTLTVKGTGSSGHGLDELRGG